MSQFHMRHVLLEVACGLARTQKWLPGHWRLVRWLNGQHGALQLLPARNRSVGRGRRLFINGADHDGLRYLIHGITAGDRLTAMMQRLLRPGDVFVDVGANVGMYSVVASLCVGESGRVLALEASPATFDRLKVITEQDPCNIALKQCAVSDVVGSTAFFIGPEDHSGVSSMRDLGAAATRRISVSTETLDVLLETWPKIRLVKIDVEGAEMAVIKGALRIIERDKPFMVMELTPTFLATFGHSLDELVRTITSRGYRCFRIRQPFEEFTGLASDEVQCDVIFVPAAEADGFRSLMGSSRPMGF